MRKRLPLIGLIVTLFSLLLSGQIGAQQTGWSTGGYHGPDITGVKIVAYTLDGEMSDGIQAAIPEFEKRTGAKVELIKVPFTAMREKLIMDFAAGTGAYDVPMVTMLEEGPLVSAHFLEPLDPYINNPDIADPDLGMDDFMARLLSVYRDKEGSLYAFPWKPDVQLYYYRKDLFEDPKEKAAFYQKYGWELKPAETWEQYWQIAEFFTRPEEDLYGCQIMGKRHNQLATQWYARFGLPLLDENLRPTFNNPRGIKTTQSFIDEQKYCPFGVTGWEWAETNTAFLKGRVAQHHTWPGLWKMAQFPTGVWGESKVLGKVGLGVLPRWKEDEVHPTMMGGWWIMVSRFSRHKVAAYKFAEWCTSEAGEPFKIPYGNDPCRRSNMDKYSKEYPVLYRVLMKAYDGAVAPPTYLPEFPEIWEAVIDEVSSAVSGLKSAELTMRDLARRIETLLEESGY